MGLSYPWVRPPIEIYTIPITGYEGVDIGQKFNVGSGFLSTHLFFGSGLNTLSAQLNVDFSFNDLRGFSVDYNLHNWLFRFSYTAANGSFSGNIECDEASVITAIATVIGGATFDQSSVECGGVDTLIVGFDAIDTIMMNAGDPSDLFVSLLQSPEDWSLQYINLALRYDDGSSLVIAEYGEAEFNKWFNPIGPSGYVLYGYRLGKWLPYISIGNLVTSPKTRQMVDTMAERITKSNSPLLGVSAAASLRQLFVDTGTIIKTRSYTVGINYWINNNMRSKLEIAHYERHKGTNGAFVTNPGSHNAVYSFAVDGLF